MIKHPRIAMHYRLPQTLVEKRDLIFDTNLVIELASLFFLDWSFDTKLGMRDSALPKM